MEVKGVTQGDITQNAGAGDSAGDLFQNGFEDESFVFAMEVTTKRDIDPTSGAITGDPIPCVLQVKKLVDKASPLLFQSLTVASGETLEITLRFYRTSSSNSKEHYYTLKFTGAKATSIRFLSQEIDGSSPTESRELEEVSFTYTKMEATHVVSGSSALYDFNN